MCVCVCFECMYTHVCSLCVLGPEMKIDPIQYGALVIKVRRNDHKPMKKTGSLPCECHVIGPWEMPRISLCDGGVGPRKTVTSRKGSSKLPNRSNSTKQKSMSTIWDWMHCQPVCNERRHGRYIMGRQPQTILGSAKQRSRPQRRSPKFVQVFWRDVS